MSLAKLKKIKYEIYVFVLFVVSRLPSLGYDMFTTDVWKWKQRIYDFGTGIFTLDFSKTIQRYHPGVSLMWIGSVSVKVFNFVYRVFTGSNPPDNEISVLFQLHFTQKLFIVLVLGLLLAFVFHILRKLFGLKYAAIALALLALEPFYVALTRVVHLEGLQSTFMLASVMSLYMFVSKGGSKKWLFGSSALASLAVLTKTSALFLVPYALLLLFGYRLIDSKKFFKSVSWALSKFSAWLLMALAMFVLIWPAMWTNADLVISTLQRGIVSVGIEGGHLQLFMGKWVEDPGYSFYWQVLGLRSSLYLFIGLVGVMALMRKLDTEKRRFVLFALLYAVFYAIEISIPSKKLDRYLLPSIVMLSLVSAFFFEYVISLLARKALRKYFLIGFFAILPAIATLAILHPDYLSYYSQMGGGLERGIWVIESKWAIGQKELISFLEQKQLEENLLDFQPGESLNNSAGKWDKRLIVAFPEKYYTQLHPLVRRMGGWATIDSIDMDSRKAQYFIYPVWFDPTDSKDSRVFSDQIYLRGVPIYNVYTNTGRVIND